MRPQITCNISFPTLNIGQQNVLYHRYRNINFGEFLLQANVLIIVNKHNLLIFEKTLKEFFF